MPCAPGDNECLLRTYLDLVAEQRDVPVDRAVHLRHDDVVVLAQLLDLDDDALEFRLRRLLFLSERQAAALARRLRRNRVALAVGLGVLTAVPAVSTLAGADRATASPASADEVVIGYSVRYERDPDFVPPPGVDIGDAMTIERDAP